MVKNTSIKTALINGVSWSLLGAVLSRGMMLFAFAVVARILGNETYGEFGIIRSTTNMFAVFAGFGLGMTATKHIAQFKNSDPKRAGGILTLATLFVFVTASFVALSVYWFSPWIAKNTINAPHLVNELKIGAFILWMSSINGAQTGTLLGFEAFRTIAKIDIFIGFVSAVSVILGSYIGQLDGAMLALAFNISLSWIVNNYAIHKESAKYGICTFTKDWREELPTLWKFSFPATLGGLMVSPVIWSCNAMLVNQPNGFGQMGIVDVANQWFMLILFIPGVVGKIVLPILSNLNEDHKKTDYINVIKFSAITNGVLALTVFLFVSLFSSLIMTAYGEPFKEGQWVLIYFSLCAVLVSINNVVGQVITSKGKMWTGLLLNIFWAISMVTLSRYFITNNYGAEGLAIAYLISYGLHSCWQIIYIRYFLKI